MPLLQSIWRPEGTRETAQACIRTGPYKGVLRPDVFCHICSSACRPDPFSKLSYIEILIAVSFECAVAVLVGNNGDVTTRLTGLFPFDGPAAPCHRLQVPPTFRSSLGAYSENNGQSGINSGVGLLALRSPRFDSYCRFIV